MTATFITPIYEPFAHAQKKPGYTFVHPPPVDCVAIVKPVGVPII